MGVTAHPVGAVGCLVGVRDARGRPMGNLPRFYCFVKCPERRQMGLNPFTVDKFLLVRFSAPNLITT